MAMTDRELLEMAAKAAGYAHLTRWSDQIRDYDSKHWGQPAMHADGIAGECDSWNPLTDDGDALRLAVKLWMVLAIDSDGMVQAIASDGEFLEPMGDDPCASTRRAIVRAAAALAKEDLAMCCDLLTDFYITELRAMHKYVETQLAWLDNLNPPPAQSDLSLSPDAGEDVVGGLDAEISA